MSRCFVDSNVWVYAFHEASDPRGVLARNYISNKPSGTDFVISYQVVNETTRILVKHGLSESVVQLIIDSMFALCNVCDFSYQSIVLASDLRDAMSISFWDSHIAAAAILAGCDSLISEDFQDASIIRGVQIDNIFREL